MKHPRTLSSLAFLLCMTALSAQAPRSFSYQAVMRDPLSGHPLSDQPAAVLFTLHQGTAAGTVVYAEQHAVTSNAQGLFSLQVGRGTPTTGAFDPIKWRNGPYFLEVSLDLGNSGAFTSMGTQELLSVPYALHAESSNVPDGTEVGQIAHWDGTTWVVDSGLYVSQKRFGIGVQVPEAPLSIHQREHLYEKFQNGDIPSQDDFTVSSGAGTGLSFDQETPTGSASRLFLQSSTGHVGIGTQDPPAPLSIVHRNILKTFFQTGDVPTQNDFAFTSDSSGFGIDQGTPESLTGRLFVRSSTGFIGMGTTQPQEKLHIEASSPNGTTGIKIKNQGTDHAGWVMGHVNDNAIAARDGAFSITEDGLTSYERITVLPGGNTGVNETMPFATLHVTKPASDPTEPVSLSENTGIAMFGPVAQHLVMDSHSIQARHLLAGATSLSGTAGTLRLQPLGGDLTIHADDASLSNHVTVTGDGKIGVGKDAIEKLDIDGAITIGNTSTAEPAPGTIRWNGTDFEGRMAGGDWAIFNGSLWEKVDNTGRIRYNPSNPKVGIGVDVPTSALHVQANEDLPDGSTAVFVNNISSMVNLLDDRYLLGLRIATTPGSGGGGGGAGGSRKSIGLYVSDVSGQSAENNLAAVLHGNVVIGDLHAASNEVGAGGTNVLAIQNGAAPAAPPSSSSGMPDAGVQLYSSSDAMGASAFHVMNGDGSVITLSRQPALTAQDGTITPGSLDPATEALINNMRTRINELEDRLKALGVLAP